MDRYNKILSKYFMVKDTDTKKLIMEKFTKNSRTLPRYIDNVLYCCGVISVNYIPEITNNKWIPFLNFNKENIFHEDKGVKDLSEYPVSANKAQEILANKVIELIHFVSFDKLHSRLSEKQ
ncbi:hypothetical protein [Aquimarina algiphila]|uniref:hypothetical protein n=1 Tax=Aquimarina algiphila TaxID=2047982 RepID=UPI00232F8A7B|nr:hypothetical protein [Aquimarina algiphila]